MSAWDVEEDHSQGRKGKSGHNAKVQLPASSQKVMMILIASLGCRWDGDILGNDCLGKGDNQHVEEGGEAFAANCSPEVTVPGKIFLGENIPGEKIPGGKTFLGENYLKQRKGSQVPWRKSK